MNMKYMKQIVINMRKKYYNELKKLSNDRDACKTAVNQSNDKRHKKESVTENMHVNIKP